MDVAQRAGVSRTTASFVMTGRRDMRISADAEQRVLQAARELNYRPSLLARSLRTNLSQTIGLLSDVIASESFAGEVVRGSMTTALLQEHLVFIGETEGDPEVEKRLVLSMLDRGVGGFVYASMYTRNVRVSKTLREQQLVLLNCIAGGKPIASVVPDERQAGRSAARELLRHGHGARIVVVGEQPAHVVAATERVAGMADELGSAGLRLAGSIDARWWPEYAYQAVRDHLRAGHRPTAFICLNDRIAMGTYQACAELGLSVPQDISVISFDDSDLARWLHPKLTSVAIPHFEMGRRAVELLLTPDRPTSIERVPMPLRVRDSVAAPAR
jgi:LacI family transcriptional regulator